MSRGADELEMSETSEFDLADHAGQASELIQAKAIRVEFIGSDSARGSGD